MDFFTGGGWLKPSLLALLFWGLWGFLTKLGAEKVPWQSTMLYFGGFTLLFALIAGPCRMQADSHHLWSLLAGIAGAVGFLFFFVALSRGPATVVIPMTSLYVAVAAILAFLILQEPLTVKKVLGIGCAIAAVILLI